MTSLQMDPASVYINSTCFGYLDTRSAWFNVLLPALYKPLTWLEVARKIKSRMRGNATELFLAVGGRNSRIGARFLQVLHGKRWTVWPPTLATGC
jgi:hypothetical protein